MRVKLLKHVALHGPQKLADLYISWFATRAYKEERYRKDCLSCVMKANVERPRISLNAVSELICVCNNNW